MDCRAVFFLSAVLLSGGCQSVKEGFSETQKSTSTVTHTWMAEPAPQMSGQSSWACDGIAYASLSEEAGSVHESLSKKGTSTQANHKIEGELADDRNKLAVQVDGQSLKFITQAAVGTGVAEPSQFTLTSNDENVLAAVVSDGPPAYAVDSFVLNKKNGLAVWTQSSPAFLISKIPYTQTVYLVCK